LVEHATENRSVGGSIPPLGTIKFRLARLLKMLAEQRLVPACSQSEAAPGTNPPQPHFDRL
jgi:hypothetical protein